MNNEKVAEELIKLAGEISGKEIVAAKGENAAMQIALAEMEEWAPGFESKNQENQAIRNMKVKSKWAGRQIYYVKTSWDAHPSTRQSGGSADWEIIVNSEIASAGD